jgi:hypothetical protein
MQFPDRETVERLRREFPRGTRVEILKMEDAQAPAPGTLGTVRRVDDLGTIHADWDKGGGLGVVLGEDECRAVRSSLTENR